MLALAEFIFCDWEQDGCFLLLVLLKDIIIQKSCCFGSTAKCQAYGSVELLNTFLVM